MLTNLNDHLKNHNTNQASNSSQVAWSNTNTKLKFCIRLTKLTNALKINLKPQYTPFKTPREVYSQNIEGFRVEFREV